MYLASKIMLFLKLHAYGYMSIYFCGMLSDTYAYIRIIRACAFIQAMLLAIYVYF